MVSKKGTFSWAVTQMNMGKKVQRHGWREKYIYADSTNNNELRWGDFEGNFHIALVTFEQTDWEIYEEPNKTLSNQIKPGQMDGGNGMGSREMIRADDVKTFIQALKMNLYGNNYINTNGKAVKEIRKIIDEMVGDKLK